MGLSKGGQASISKTHLPFHLLKVLAELEANNKLFAQQRAGLNVLGAATDHRVTAGNSNRALNEAASVKHLCSQVLSSLQRPF